MSCVIVSDSIAYDYVFRRGASVVLCMYIFFDHHHITIIILRVMLFIIITRDQFCSAGATFVMNIVVWLRDLQLRMKLKSENLWLSDLRDSGALYVLALKRFWHTGALKVLAYYGA